MGSQSQTWLSDFHLHFHPQLQRAPCYSKSLNLCLLISVQLPWPPLPHPSPAPGPLHWLLLYPRTFTGLFPHYIWGSVHHSRSLFSFQARWDLRPPGHFWSCWVRFLSCPSFHAVAPSSACVPPADHSSFTVVPVTSAEASKGKAPVHLTYAAFFVPQRCPERTICSVKIGWMNKGMNE